MTGAMTTARPWLPEKALTAPRTAGPIAETIGEWARHWFAEPALRAAQRWARLPSPAEQANETWSPSRPLSRHMSVQYRTDARDVIGSALLAFPGPRGIRHAKDRQLMQLVSDSVLADLTDRLERFTAGLDGPAWSPGDSQAAHGFLLAIADDTGRAVIRLLADPALLVALARQGVETRKGIVPLTGRADALAEVRVACGALLGRANLPYRDVRGLAVGDVLVLGARREAACDLLVDGRVARRRAFRVPAVDTTILSQ